RRTGIACKPSLNWRTWLRLTSTMRTSLCSPIEPPDRMIKLEEYRATWLFRLLPAIQGSRKRTAHGDVVLRLGCVGALNDFASVAAFDRLQSPHVACVDSYAEPTVRPAVAVQVDAESAEQLR